MSPTPRDIHSSRSFPGDRRAWLLMLIASLVLSLGGCAWRHRRLVEAFPLCAPSNRAFRLAVLEYGRIVEAPDGRHVTGAQVEGQLRMLHDRGFTPVTASQVAAAYEHRSALPDRSVLLVFYGGYLSTYDCVHPLLARMRWPAAMFLQTDRQAARDPVFLYWDRLQVMADSGIWELGVHGEPGQAGRTGEDSFRTSRALVEAHVHTRVMAYARLVGITPPLSGQPAGGDGPSLGFQTSLFGINDPDSQPLRLNTLHVDPADTPQQLGRRLEASLAAPGTDEDGSLDRLVSDRTGRVQASPDGLALEGDRRSAVWLAGSRWVQDWCFEAKVRCDGGQFWFEQDGLADGRSWRFGGNPTGLHVQERSADGVTRTLANLPPVSTGWHAFRLIHRGSGLWLECDGQPLAERPCRLSGTWHGDLGIVAAAEAGPGRLLIAEVRFHPQPFLMLPCSGNPQSAEIQRLVQQAGQAAAISPAWIVVAGGGQKEAPLNQDLIGMLRDRFAWAVLPEIQFRDPSDPATSRLLEERLEQAARAGWDGVRVDLEGLPEPDRRAWEATVSRLEVQLQRRNLHLQILTTCSSKEIRHES